MKHLGNTALTMAAAAALTISALAQQSNATPDKSMPGCHKDMQSMMEKNTQTTKDIEAAKVSNDPAKMRAALDEAEEALKPMTDHMNKCMGMMEKMHGKGGMMGGHQGDQSKPGV